MFKTGQQVRILDATSAYHGHVGPVLCIAIYGGVQILTVLIHGNVTCAVRETLADFA